MEQLIKQDLEAFSNHEFSLPNYRKLNLPRYDRHTSFAQVSNWGNSDHLESTILLPRIATRPESLQSKPKVYSKHSQYPSNCCPVKQMDINLQPLRNDEDSYYCKYIKNKNKSPLRQIEFITSTDRSKKGRQSSSSRGEVMSVAKLKEIIKRRKADQHNYNLDQYLRTTQLINQLQSRADNKNKH